MSTLNTSADILDWVLFNAGEPTDGTSDFYNITIDCLNRAYREIWTGGGSLAPDVNEPWLWLKKDPPGVLTLQPVYNTGTAWVTNNNTAVLLSQTYPTSLAGRFFKVSDHPDVFRIASHTAGTANLQLDSVYTGDTNSAASFNAMQLEYSLAGDVFRIIAPMRVYQDSRQEIDGVDLSALERDYPLAYVEAGTPTRFAHVTESKIRFNRYGGTDATGYIRVEYDYLAVPSDLADDSNQPLIPFRNRQVLADYTLFYLLQLKSDQRAADVGAQAKAGLIDMANENKARRAQMSRIYGAIMTRPRNTGRMDRVLRTESGVIIG